MNRRDLLNALEDHPVTPPPQITGKRTLSNPKDRTQTVTTSLTISQAIKIIDKIEHKNNFQMSLISSARQYGEGMFDTMKFWLFKVAEDLKDNRYYPLQGGIHEELTTMFVASGLQKPMVQWIFPRQGKIKIFPGSNHEIVVMYGNIYYGSIQEDDCFHPAHACKGDDNVVITQLMLMSLNPLRFFITFGKDSGICCFCGITLTTDRSVSKGYGPICADRWGLAW